ncbi:MAG: hypothetical protein FJ135_02500 [Deltaproteobacteria bacterium]|nr:hypothetical protein [Deltaproteobacteria bacterium]
MRKTTAIRGIIEEICFHDPKLNVVIATLREEHTDDLVKISGFNLPLPYGDLLELTGIWLIDAETGHQFRVSQVTVLEYASLDTTIRHVRAMMERRKAGGGHTKTAAATV